MRRAVHIVFLLLMSPLLSGCATSQIINRIELTRFPRVSADRAIVAHLEPAQDVVTEDERELLSTTNRHLQHYLGETNLFQTITSRDDIGPGPAPENTYYVRYRVAEFHIERRYNPGFYFNFALGLLCLVPLLWGEMIPERSEQIQATIELTLYDISGRDSVQYHNAITNTQVRAYDAVGLEPLFTRQFDVEIEARFEPYNPDENNRGEDVIFESEVAIQLVWRILNESTPDISRVLGQSSGIDSPSPAESRPWPERSSFK